MDQLTVADAIEFEDLARSTIADALTAAAQGAPTARQAAAIVATVEQADAGDVLRRPYPDVMRTAVAVARDGAAPDPGPPPDDRGAVEELGALLEQLQKQQAAAEVDDLVEEG